MQTARYWEFYSVVRTVGEQETVLADIKVVEDGYPFYGRCILESDRALSAVLEAGAVVVEHT